MLTVLPTTLPDRLTAYLPERITFVGAEAWPAALTGRFERTGVRTSIPRYALDLRTQKDEVDPARVRRLAEGSTIRSLATRHVHVVAHLGELWIVEGHTTLAAHLAARTEAIPVRLVRRIDAPTNWSPPASAPSSPVRPRGA